METLYWIIGAAFFGGIVSVVAASLITRFVSFNTVPVLISYAVGAMLGAVFLDIIPHAIETTADVHSLGLTLLLGILSFFLLEKLVLWRHCHGHDAAGSHCSAHNAVPVSHDHGRSGLLILIGDTFHNFVDGILIAAAFMQSTELGIVTALAMIAHEIPQELGDFLVLLHSGYTRTRALVFNLLSSFATLVGGLIGWWALSDTRELIPPLLALAASSMLYVAVADLIPGLHKKTELRATVLQITLICLGILTIFFVGHIIGGHD